MGINRAPFNALVDDTGNGLTGSIWNKAAIQNVLLDPIDANPAWIDVPFNAANFTALAPMTWTMTAGAVARNRYAVIGKVMYWSFFLVWYAGGNTLSGSPSAALNMFVPGGVTPAGTQFMAIDYTAGVAGVATVAGLYAQPSGTALVINKGNNANFALSDVPGLVANLAFEIL